MKERKFMKISVLVVGALIGAIFAGLVGTVVAPPVGPYNVWGEPATWGETSGAAANTGPGQNISAWIDGVCYGNATTGSFSEFDLYVEGDIWGDTENNSCKYGGYEGDVVYYMINYAPTDYHLSISNLTTTFVNMTVERWDLFFDTNTSWEGMASTNLRGLKINEIVADPGDGFPDYVYIYDSGGEVDLTALRNSYYLQKDDPWPTNPPDPYGPIFDFASNPSYVTDAGSDLYYINLTGFDLENADELKLVWRNPGYDDIANGNDIIVDRVEWGNHINHISTTDPPDERDYDNTSLLDCDGAVTIGGSFKRTTNGFDTDNCANDFDPQPIATPRYDEPRTIDYIVITTGPGGTELNIEDVIVGGTLTAFASGYNGTYPTGTYVTLVPVTWTGGGGSWAPGTGTSSTYTAGITPGLYLQTGANATLSDTFNINILPMEIDYIIITSSPGGPPLGTVSIDVGQTVTAYASGYNITGGDIYVGLVDVSWSDLPDYGTFDNSTGTSTTFTAVSVGLTTITGENLSMTPVVSDTFDVNIGVAFGEVGAATELRVHKGPWNGVGTSSDLVLNWTAPTWNYTSLKYNIVYYDTDISDGFQYTSNMLFEPNSTGSGTEDGCILEGFLADANNYAFIVHTTNGTVGSYENMTGTNIGYKYGIELLKNPSPLTSQLFVSIPYHSDWKKASDIAGPGTEFINNSIITAVLRWNYSTQRYDARTWWGAPFNQWVGDFDIDPGDALAVGVSTTTPYIWNLVGSYDETLQFEFLKNTPPLTSQMFVSLPYHKSYVMASDISGPGTEFTNGSIIIAVLQWNYSTQRYDARTWWGAPFNQWVGEFAITLSPGDHLAFGIATENPYYWQPWVISL